MPSLAGAFWDSFGSQQSIEFAGTLPWQFFMQQQIVLESNETKLVNSESSVFPETASFHRPIAIFLDPDCNLMETCSLQLDIPPEAEVHCLTPDLCGQAAESAGKIIFHPVHPFAQLSITHLHSQKKFHLLVLEEALNKEGVRNENPDAYKKKPKYCGEYSKPFIEHQQYPIHFCHYRAQDMTFQIASEDENPAEIAPLSINIYRGNTFEQVDLQPLVPGIISDGETIEPAWLNEQQLTVQEPDSVNVSLIFVQIKGHPVWHNLFRLEQLISNWPSLPDEVRKLGLRVIESDHWLFHHQGPIIWRAILKKNVPAFELNTPRGWQTATPDLLGILNTPWYETSFWKGLFEYLDSGTGPYGFSTPNNMALAALFERWRQEANQENRKTQKRDRRGKPEPFTPLLPSGAMGKQVPYTPQDTKGTGTKGTKGKRGQPPSRKSRSDGSHRAAAGYRPAHDRHSAGASPSPRTYATPIQKRRLIPADKKKLLEHGFGLLAKKEPLEALRIAEELFSTYGPRYLEYQQIIQLKVRAYSDMKDFRNAQEFYEGIQGKIRYPSADLQLAWAKVLEGLGRTGEAVNILEPLYRHVDTTRRDWELHLKKFGLALLRAYQANKVMEKALDTGNELSQKLPDDPDIILANVRVMESMNKIELNQKCSDMLKKAMLRHPKNQELALAYVLLHENWVYVDPDCMVFTERIINEYASKYPTNEIFAQSLQRFGVFKENDFKMAQKVRKLFDYMYSSKGPSAQLLDDSDNLLEKCHVKSRMYPQLVELKANAFFRLRRLNECIELLDRATPKGPKLAFIKAQALQERKSPGDVESAVRIFDELYRDVDSGSKSFKKLKIHTGQALIHACINWDDKESMPIRERTAIDLNTLFPGDRDLTMQLIKVYEEQGDMDSLSKAKSVALEAWRSGNGDSNELKRHVTALNKLTWHSGTMPKLWFDQKDRITVLQALYKVFEKPSETLAVITQIMKKYDSKHCLNYMDIVEFQCDALVKSKRHHDCLEVIAKQCVPAEKLPLQLMFLKGVSLFKRNRNPNDLTEARKLLEKTYEMAVDMDVKIKHAERLGQVLLAIKEQEATKRAQTLFLEMWELTKDVIFRILYIGALALSEDPKEAEDGCREIKKIFTDTTGQSRKQDIIWGGVLLNLSDWDKFDHLQLDKKYPDNCSALLIVSIRYSHQLHSEDPSEDPSVDPDKEDQFPGLLKNAINYAKLALNANGEDISAKKQLINCYVVLKNHPQYYQMFHFESVEDISRSIDNINTSMQFH